MHVAGIGVVRRGRPRLMLSILAVAALGFGSPALLPAAQTVAAGGASVWLQTMDSCKEAVGSAGYQIVDPSNLVNFVVTTPAVTPVAVSSGACPLQRGNCSTLSAGCVQFSNLPFADTFKIHETATPPSNASNPLGYAPCNGGSACQSELVNVTIDSSGTVSAVTTVTQPNGVKQVYPSSGSFTGTAADPIVFHDYGLGGGNCDSDSDADDHLTGGTPASCSYSPESGEASTCQPYPWSCTLAIIPATSPAATHFVLSGPGSVTSGTPFIETITAETATNAVATSFASGTPLKWSGPTASSSGQQPLYPPNPVSFNGGVAQVSITIFGPQTTSLSVRHGSLSGTSPAFTVN